MVSSGTARGATRLVFDAVEGVTTTVEAMHETIARRPLPRSSTPALATGAHGLIAASIYAAIRGTNAAIREGTDALLGVSTRRLAAQPQTPAELRAVGALNGVMGDHLEDSGNALALPMTLLAGDTPLDLERDALRAALPAAGGDVVILVHGLCLTEHCWAAKESDAGLAARLAAGGRRTVLHLRYNSGRHISTNGRELADLLDRLGDAWPVEITSLSLIGHSMGGLVIRSACWYGKRRRSRAVERVRRVVCLGTPHHGSMLEKAGHALDLAFRKYPYLAPFAFGRHRSAGIKDLRHGNLLDEDWQGACDDGPREDLRRAVPMLAGADYYFVAAVIGASHDHPLSFLLGDLLVRLDSAVGSHRDAAKSLPMSEDNCRVFCEQDHFDLLGDVRVHEQILEWFDGDGTRPSA